MVVPRSRQPARFHKEGKWSCRHGRERDKGPETWSKALNFAPCNLCCCTTKLVKGPRHLGLVYNLKLGGVNVVLSCHSWDLTPVELKLNFRNARTVPAQHAVLALDLVNI